MYKEISLMCTDGKEKSFSFLSTGTTAYRYKQVFHEDLMILLNKMGNDDDDQTDMGVGGKLAYIMNCQADKQDMNKLSFDAFLGWADKLESSELFMHMKEFVSLYLGSRKTSSTPKKEGAPQNAK